MSGTNEIIIATFRTANDKFVAKWEFESAHFPPSDAELKEIMTALKREIHYATTGEILNVWK